jgi:hypothetical protein
MTIDVESILEECLSQLATGEGTVQDCLAAHPQEAHELRPLLLAAEGMRAVRKPTLPPAAKVRIEAQVLGAFDAGAEARQDAGRRARIRPTWRWLPVGLGAAAVFAILLLAVLGLAQTALPGSPLYGVKRAVEDVRLWATPADAEPALRLRFAQRRLDEMEALAARGQVDLSLVEALLREAETVLAQAEGLPAARALSLVEELARVTDRATQALNNLLAGGADVPRDRILLALGSTQKLMARAQALMEELREQVLPTATPTPEPTDTLRPGETPPPTPTPTPPPIATSAAGEAPAPTDTPAAGEAPLPTDTPAAGEPPPPTSTPDDGKEPKPTKATPPGQTNTPEPPKWGHTKTPPAPTATPEAGSMPQPTSPPTSKDKSKGVGK